MPPLYYAGQEVCVIGASRGIGLEVRETAKQQQQQQQQ
jgi:short-subunit dehydrogenase